MRTLRLPLTVVHRMTEHAAHTYPDECCGIIAGKGNRALECIAVDNVAAYPANQYRMDASQQLRALKAIEADQLEWIGVYHSHPGGEPLPSEVDKTDAWFNTPNMVHVIIGLHQQRTDIQGWHMHNGQVDSVELLVENQTSYALQPLSRLQLWSVILSIVLGVAILLALSFTLLPPAPPIPTPQ